jgi:hypothetical protein
MTKISSSGLRPELRKGYLLKRVPDRKIGSELIERKLHEIIKEPVLAGIIRVWIPEFIAKVQADRKICEFHS